VRIGMRIFEGAAEVVGSLHIVCVELERLKEGSGFRIQGSGKKGFGWSGCQGIGRLTT